VASLSSILQRQPPQHPDRRQQRVTKRTGRISAHVLLTDGACKLPLSAHPTTSSTQGCPHASSSTWLDLRSPMHLAWLCVCATQPAGSTTPTGCLIACYCLLLMPQECLTMLHVRYI
jgi:hypothetical protein